ncbi:Methyltransferase domain-containing protein [Pseudomonas cuatrocienegasensis]|uniref:Methyltransferase domain-containing protein n=1 Tax=Pseudomonas cuatrocienegasensis TaxID=543360 RepID=A0ABY1BNM5_9PSED|nr:MULTISPECIES: class I SAM-dependent methyltransferase [Pseudomonas]OEC33722.1 methyltransferase [Pseudomonas sp. 21C1]SER25871.1 Methyltransferase domain-containing protein [Pseudomonas cuatrocienegasensis]
MTKPDTPLTAISELTLRHYQTCAEAFREGTRDHDVSQNIAALLRHLHAPAPACILDLGCGPGRDLRTFSQLGHRAIGLDGCSQFVEMARQDSGCDVWQQNLLSLDLPAEHFDGIFANAVLFHVPSRALPEVLKQLWQSLKAGGVLFCSNPRGDNQEGWQGERYAVYHDLPRWRQYLQAAGFSELEHYYRPAGLPRDQQPWLASVWRKAPRVTIPDPNTADPGTPI